MLQWKYTMMIKDVAKITPTSGFWKSTSNLKNDDDFKFRSNQNLKNMTSPPP